MSEMCREFGISRKTGYKIFDRYKDHGLEALSDRSRRPVRYANQLPPQIETLITACQAGKAALGRAAKSANFWCASLDGDFRVPAKSTIHAVLCRHGSGQAARPRCAVAPQGTPLSKRRQPQRALVRGLQGRVQARRRTLLLSPYRHRPRLAISAALRGARIHARRPRHHRLRTALSRARLARRHPLRQRRALRQSQRPVQPLQALRLVAAPGHRHRAHQARPSPAERPP